VLEALYGLVQSRSVKLGLVWKALVWEGLVWNDWFCRLFLRLGPQWPASEVKVYKEVALEVPTWEER